MLELLHFSSINGKILLLVFPGQLVHREKKHCSRIFLVAKYHAFLLCFSSLGDRKPVESEDEIVVLIVPDHQMLEYVQKIASELSDDPVNLHSLSPKESIFNINNIQVNALTVVKVLIYLLA